ncbi:hypothetical protein [Candidatus Chrysopegis kryptomonas]|uniref:Uncharacterized protein n=1 Tax=Candidatus Chryseopegocella kryptomonas TaxID=1633643 RepID=A0A0P1NUD5_9BACT|nr:hypothetical protein [Candidatus Chrysopegis kryptomonas]CUT02565.1 hypothetical protein JGI23_01276 [Candidatus Chrysopegis kryptomonas]
MFESLIYIFKLYVGFAIISYFALRLRFWDECVGGDCVFKSLFYFLLFLFPILFFAVKFKTLDAFFVVSVLFLILGVDFLSAKRKSGVRINFVKTFLNQKIYDFLDGIAGFRFKFSSLKLKFEYVLLVIVFSFGLFFWINPSLQTLSLFSIIQHNNLVKITSMLVNNFSSGINNVGMNSICAFLSLIFGVNQHIVLHLFGALNYGLIFVGISLLTYRLTKNLHSVILASSLFAFVFLRFNFVLNHVEGSSFLLGLGWLLMVIYFWKDLRLFQKILALFVAFLIEFFAGSVLAFSVVVAELFESGFKNKKKLHFLFAILISLLPFAIEIFSRGNPEFGIKAFAFFQSPELIGHSEEILNVVVFLTFLSVVLMLSSQIFYGIFSLILLIFTIASEISVLNFVPYEQFFPISVLLFFIWFSVMLRKVFGSKEKLHSIFVILIVVFLVLSVFIYGGVKIDGAIEPDEFVKVVLKIQKENLPFSFAIVSHYGTRAMVENWSYFMDWDYFLRNYILIEDEKKIYELVYVFVPEKNAMGKIHQSFIPRIDNLTATLDSACVNYRFANVEIYFDGDYVKVYKLTKLKK